MIRTDTCTVCGAEFVVKPTHPMVENDQWCAECVNGTRLLAMVQYLDHLHLRASRTIRPSSRWDEYDSFREVVDKAFKRGNVDTALGSGKEAS